ncbi:MAG: S1 RNA-binding domain-containing protein [Candidatus Promineofilum sp.]|nr:S1 RNA-binding domain-containing protein [Promineifilum sp.]
MSEESMHSLEDLLDQHDYDMPQAGDIRMGVIVANTPQGLIVDLGLKRDGIVPQSDLAKLEPEERDALKVNDEVPIYVVETEDPEALVVSIHLARLNQDWIEAEALLASGEIFEGEVIGYNKGGVIVPYGRIRGFVPISHLSDVTPGMGERRRQQRLARVRGETIGVKIIEVDRHRHRLVMSQREAQREWEDKKRGELMETLQAGETRTGRVSGMRDFGAFVDLGGADGLVHISELSWHRIDHPREVVKLGDEIEVFVLGIDKDSGRISLSRKKLLANPWDTVAQRYVQNQLVEGKITRILDYGAFSEIEPGVEGLLHISQLSRNPVEDPRAVVKEGEVHLLRVVSIDQKRQRIGLSLKAVTATEQIEWMAQKELAEALRQEEEEAAAAARGPIRQVEEDQSAPVDNEGSEEATATADAADAVVETAEDMAGDAADAMEETVKAADDAVDEAVDTAADAADSVVETAEDMAGDAADAVEETVEAADDAVDEAVDTAAHAADSVVETAEDMAGDSADAGESAVETAEDVAGDAADAVEETAQSAEEAGETLIDTVQDTAGSVVDAAKNIVGSVVEKVAAVIEEVIESPETTEGETG